VPAAVSPELGLELFLLPLFKGTGRRSSWDKPEDLPVNVALLPFGVKRYRQVKLLNVHFMKKHVILVWLWVAMFLALPKTSKAQFEFSDIQFWVGTGQFKTAVVVDFNDGTSEECFVWGYRFDDTTSVTAETCFRDIDSADASLSFDIAGGFLNSAFYGSHQAIGGTNNWYFATFNSLKTFGNWSMNNGLSEILKDSLWFGASFTPWDTNWMPVYLPENPVPASQPTRLVYYRTKDSYIYPNPIRSIAFIEDSFAKLIEVYSLDGRKITDIIPANGTFDVSNLKEGFYFFRWASQGRFHTSLILIER